MVLAVMTGFQDGIRDRIIAGSPHLLIFQSGGQGLRGGRAHRRPGAGRPGRSFGHAVRPPAGALHDGRRAARAAGLIRGVDLVDPGGPEGRPVAAAPGSLQPLADGQPAILLGREMARTLGVFTGDSVTVISPEGAITAVGMVPKMRRYTVTGTIEIGMHEYDSSIAYLSLPAAKEFAGLPAGVSGIEVKLTDPFDARRRSAERWPRRWARASGYATGWR